MGGQLWKPLIEVSNDQKTHLNGLMLEEGPSPKYHTTIVPGYSQHNASIYGDNMMDNVVQSPNKLAIALCLTSYAFLLEHEYEPVICKSSLFW